MADALMSPSVYFTAWSTEEAAEKKLLNRLVRVDWSWRAA
jgi:hypothetical protein